MLLSIILPCYNVEKYLGECLDSLFEQDIPESEYEVICVNDCSPDKLTDVILDYQKLHSNLILIEHEVNRRQGGARNSGMRVAKGKYIWFVDPDDYIERNCFYKLINELETKKIDILLFNHYKLDKDSTLLPVTNISKINGIINGKEWISLQKNLNILYNVVKLRNLIKHQ